VDDGLGWKDGDTMHWWVLLTEDNTVCMSEGARLSRARIYAFHFKPPSKHLTHTLHIPSESLDNKNR
jgi:hypothetical protein